MPSKQIYIVAVSADNVLETRFVYQNNVIRVHGGTFMFAPILKRGLNTKRVYIFGRVQIQPPKGQ